MKEKILELTSSIRFWVATFAWLSDYLAEVSANGFDVVVLFTQLSYWLGTIVAIGTADSIATKFSSKKAE